MEEEKSYKQIFKATSLFGGVQVITILISIIKSKFIAVLLGPAGIGISGLLNSTLLFIAALTNFGIERSAVKNVAEANSSGNKEKTTMVISVLRRLVWITGFLGAILTFIFSSFLSKITFGNEDYTIGFMILSITLLLNQITAGEKVVLRGLRKLKDIAQSTLWGAILGLIISIPLYYLYGIDGIVPAILLSAISTLIITLYFSKKTHIVNIKIGKKDLLIQGKDLLVMGFFLSLTSLMILGESYIVRLYVRLAGSIEDVGFYNAGFAIVNSYFGVVFSALTIDYYPRLAGVANDNKKVVELMNQQSEMTILIIAPILAVFIIFINFFVILLYSNDFLPITAMMLWAGFGIYFKAISWALGVVFISKGDVKVLFFSELGAILVMLSLNLLGYKFYGLEGLGISFLLAYIYAFIQNFIIVKYKYSFKYSKEFYKFFFIQLFLGILCFLTVKFYSGLWLYLLGGIIILSSSIYSIKILDEKINILNVIVKKIKK